MRSRLRLAISQHLEPDNASSIFAASPVRAKVSFEVVLRGAAASIRLIPSRSVRYPKHGSPQGEVAAGRRAASAQSPKRIVSCSWVELCVFNPRAPCSYLPTRSGTRSVSQQQDTVSGGAAAMQRPITHIEQPAFPDGLSSRWIWLGVSSSLEG